MPAPLNIFQRAMLHWNDLHPYNAVHVVRLPGPFEAARLQRALQGQVIAPGLTNLQLHREQRKFHYHGGAANLEVRCLAAAGNPEAALAHEIEAQLNRRFPCEAVFEPLRFFVLPDGDAFFLGVTYFHPAADAEALVHFLKRLVAHYRADQAPAPRLEIHPARRDQLWRQPGILLRKLADFPRQFRQMRHSCRARFANPADGHNGYLGFTLAPGALDDLVRISKARGATVNDLLLAALLLGLAPLAAERLTARRRRRLSVGCIVNLRKELGVDSEPTFGLYLGSFIISHEVGEDRGVAALALELQRQTAAIKQRRLYLGSGLELAVAGRVLSLFSTERRRKIYQKNYPLWGGITNMNLNALWPQVAGTPPVDYFRAVSTGPVTPLVLSVTTLGRAVNLGLTYRTTVFAAHQIQEFRARFEAGIRGLAQA